MTTPDYRVLRRDLRGLASTLGVVLFLVASVEPAGADGPVITEFMVVNHTTVADQDGAYSPWVEIRNLGAHSTNLLGWTLTDNTSSPEKWVFPGMELAPGQCIVVFASGKNRAISGQELHTNFRLSSSGGYLGLRHPSGSVASEWVSYPPQAPDLSYGSFLYVTESEPLVTNGASVSYFVAV